MYLIAERELQILDLDYKCYRKENLIEDQLTGLFLVNKAERIKNKISINLRCLLLIRVKKISIRLSMLIYFGFRIFRVKPSLNIVLKHKRIVNSEIINNLAYCASCFK